MVFLHRFFDFRRGVIFIMLGKDLFGLHMDTHAGADAAAVHDRGRIVF